MSDFPMTQEWFEHWLRREAAERPDTRLACGSSSKCVMAQAIVAATGRKRARFASKWTAFDGRGSEADFHHAPKWARDTAQWFDALAPFGAPLPVCGVWRAYAAWRGLDPSLEFPDNPTGAMLTAALAEGARA